MFELFGLGADFTFDAHGTEHIQSVVARLETLSTQLHLTEAETQEYSATLTEFGNILTSMGTSMMVAGTAQTAVALYGVGKAAEWQTQMIDASRYMMDDSAEAQTKYNKAIKETAQLLGKTKEEINESTISYMMMGKSEDEALRLAKNAGYAAVAWDMTAGEVADSFRTIKAAFNVNLEDQDMYQRYLDTINEVGNSTAATSKDVIAFLADGGSALHNVANVSIEQAMGMASAARYANMSIAEFSTMMIRLGNQYAEDKSTEYFTNLGIEVKDANGEMRSFAEVLYDVQKKWNDMDQATRSSFASGVGGVYADRLSLYMGSGDEYIKGANIAQQDNSGSAEAEFNRVTDTFAMAMSRFQVTLSDFGTAFWGTLLPPLTKFVNMLNNVMTVISNFAQEHPGIMKIVASFILLSGILMTTVGVGLLVAGMLTKLRASQVMGHVATLKTQILTRGLSAVFGGLGHSIGNVLLRFTKLSLAMGVVYLGWKYDLFNIRSMYEDFTSRMKLSLDTSRKLLSNGISLDKFKNQIDSLNKSNSVFDKLTLGITKAGLALKGLGQYITKGFLDDDMFQKLNAMGLMPMISIVIGLGMRFKALWKGIKDGFTDTIKAVNNGIRKIFGPAFTWLHDKILLPVAKAIFGIDDDVKNLKEAVSGIQFVDLDKMFGKIETWEKVGRVIGIVGGSLFILRSATKGLGALSGIAGIIGTIASLFGRLGGHGGGGGLFGGLLSWLFGGSHSGGHGGGTGGMPTGGRSLVPNPMNIVKGMADIAIILGGFTVIFEAYGALSTVPGFDLFLSKGISTLKLMFSGIFELAGGIAIMAILSGSLSNFKPSTFAKGMADIAIILGGFTVIFEAYGALTQIPYFTEFLTTGSQTLSLLLNGMEIFASPKFAILGAITAVAGMIGVETFAKGMADIAIILGGFTVIFEAYGALTQIPYFTEFLTTGGQTLSLLLESMSIFVSPQFIGLGAITAVAGMINPAVFAKGMAGVAIVIGGMTAVIEAFGALTQIPYFTEFLTTGGQTLSLLFEQLGSVIGSFVGGIGEGISSTLPEFGKNLAKFGKNIQPFFGSISSIDTDGVSKFMTSFGTFMGFLAGDKLVSLFTGKTDLPGLGEQLSEFGDSASGFFTTVATYPEDGITKAKLTFEALKGIGDYDFKSGGIAQLFTGNTNLAGLGEQLSEFGDSASGFFTTVATFSDDGFEKAKLTFEALKGIGDYDFKSGGAAQLVTGEVDLAGVGRQLTIFGTSVQGFFMTVATFPENSFEKVKMVFEALKGIGDYDFKSGGAAQLVTGEVDLAGVGLKLTQFGTSVQGFFLVASYIPEDGITKAKQIFVALSGIGEFAEASLMLTNIENVGTQLTNFINNVEAFFTKAVTIDTSGVSNITQPLTELFNTFAMADAGNISAMADSLTDVSNSVIQLNSDLESLSSTIITEFSNSVDQVSKYCTDLSTNISTSITSGKEQIINAVSDICSSVNSTFNTLSVTARTYGINMTNAFADGIRSRKSAVASAAHDVVKSAKDYMGFHSPSKKGEGRFITEWGYNMVSGFADGINSASGMLNNTMSKVISNPVSDVMNNMAELPLSASLTQNSTISADASIVGYLGQMVILLNTIANKNVYGIDNQFNSNSNGSISYNPIEQAKTRVSETKELVSSSKSYEIKFNIEKGAIENHYHLDGNNINKDDIVNLIENMMDENLLPILLNKLSELKIALNE